MAMDNLAPRMRGVAARAPLRALLRALLLALAAGAGGCANFNQFSAKGGAWEMTQTTTARGMAIPPEELARMPPLRRAQALERLLVMEKTGVTHVHRVCYPGWVLDKNHIPLLAVGDDHCMRRVVSRSTHRVVLEQTCPAPANFTFTIVIEAPQPDRVLMHADLVDRAGGTAHMEATGRWLGGDCEGVPSPYVYPAPPGPAGAPVQ